ncbi:FecCD family ABC transporter permease [Cohnella abietis]|uniref:Iron ABC transporter permease n=1 Tax=Cohnella abietis TaxID=2507935 RepID=A0A3T1D690_9BACL|nr:iron ABC transporter permease [Cohnella abietis]BBI33592.1 iron ABC transporter permease [Cohnella abietis]
MKETIKLKARSFLQGGQGKGTKITLLLVLLTICGIISIGIGTLSISPLHVVELLFTGDRDSAEGLVVWSFRLPRFVLAIIAGAALAVSGTVLQGVVRNPLASPDIVGVTSGASMVAVCYLAFLNEKLGMGFMPLFAFAGAALVSLFIYILSWKKGISPFRMILVGLAVTSLLEAGKTLFLIFSPIFLTSQAQIWITGSIYGAKWGNVLALLPWFCVLFALLLLMSRKLDIQILGEETTISLGGRLQLQRIALIGIASALAGSAIAFVGGIGFIGLMAPHIARRLVGGTHFVLLIASAIVGALLLGGADLMGRLLFSPKDVAAGVFTAVLGAPFFLYLLMTSRKNEV